MTVLDYFGRILAYLGIALSATYPNPRVGLFFGGLLIVIGSLLLEHKEINKET